VELDEPCDRQTLYRVAYYQKAVLVCVLVSLLAVGAPFLLPEEAILGAYVALLVASVISTVFVFLLAAKLYGTGAGVFFGLLTLIPYLGLLVLLAINGKATSVLKAHGIRVGLLGANLSVFADEQTDRVTRGESNQSQVTEQAPIRETSRQNEQEVCYLCGARLEAHELKSRICDACQE
jgi:hypothetical protein